LKGNGLSYFASSAVEKCQSGSQAWKRNHDMYKIAIKQCFRIE